MTSHPSAADELVAAGRLVESLGLCPARSGNISVRTGDRVLITPTGTQLGALDADRLSELSMAGELLSGPQPSKEWLLHLRFYARDPAFRAVVHLHSPYAVAAACRAPWSAVSALPPLTPYFVMRVGPVPLLAYARPGSDDLPDILDRTPGTFRAALLARHGSIVAHGALRDAVDAAVELEQAAQLATVVGTGAQPLSAREISDLVDAFGCLAW